MRILIIHFTVLLSLSGACLHASEEETSPEPISSAGASNGEQEEKEITELIETEEPRKAPLKSEEDLSTQMFTVPSPRGLVTDRYGNPLAQTRTASFLALKVGALKEMGDADQACEAIEKVLSATPGLEKFSFSKEDFHIHWKHRAFVPFPLSDPLTAAEEKSLRPIVEASNLLSLEPRFVREYPLGSAAAHITGFTRKLMPFQHGPLSEPENLWPQEVGTLGLEKEFEEVLSGTDGQASYLFDDQGLISDIVLIEETDIGDILVTTLNAPMQELAYSVLKKNGKPGAMVILDSLTGDILAMASYPSFDPNIFVKGISDAEYASLESDPDAPLFHRATMGTFPPGSTFKPFVALAGMDKGVIRGSLTRFDTPPSLNIDGRNFHNWNRENEGMLDVRYALLRSSNTWFYQAGIQTGGPSILQTARAYGFATAPEIPLPAAAGNLPIAKNAIANQAVANLSIGQGEVLVTPLQLGLAMSGLSVGKYVPKPRLIIQSQDSRTNEILETHPVEKRSYLNSRQSDRLAVRAGMWGVVNHEAGTGKAAASELPQVYGKTGTSQRTLAGKDANVAWFAGYVGSNSPRISFAVLVEGREGESLSGGKSAAPLVGEFVRTVYAEREKYNVEVTVTHPVDPMQQTSPVPTNIPQAIPGAPTTTVTPPTSTSVIPPPASTRVTEASVPQLQATPMDPRQQRISNRPTYRVSPVYSTVRQ